MCYPRSQNRDLGHPFLAVGELYKSKSRRKAGPSTSRAARSAARRALDDAAKKGSCDPMSQSRDMGHPFFVLDEGTKSRRRSPFDSDSFPTPATKASRRGPRFAIFAQGRLSAPLKNASLRMTTRKIGFVLSHVPESGHGAPIFGVRVKACYGRVVLMFPALRPNFKMQVLRLVAMATRLE